MRSPKNLKLEYVVEQTFLFQTRGRSLLYLFPFRFYRQKCNPMSRRNSLHRFFNRNGYFSKNSSAQMRSPKNLKLEYVVEQTFLFQTRGRSLLYLFPFRFYRQKCNPMSRRNSLHRFFNRNGYFSKNSSAQMRSPKNLKLQYVVEQTQSKNLYIIYHQLDWFVYFNSMTYER